MLKAIIPLERGGLEPSVMESYTHEAKNAVIARKF
jgi:hypothetical protein